jgi:hypothetical protein
VYFRDFHISATGILVGRLRNAHHKRALQRREVELCPSAVAEVSFPLLSGLFVVFGLVRDESRIAFLILISSNFT